jgi:hypothetical protein
VDPGRAVKVDLFKKLGLFIKNEQTTIAQIIGFVQNLHKFIKREQADES